MTIALVWEKFSLDVLVHPLGQRGETYPPKVKAKLDGQSRPGDMIPLPPAHHHLSPSKGLAFSK